MKVIVTKGRKFMQTKCKTCGCVFKFEESDIEKKEPITECGVTWRTDFILTCPDCENKFVASDTCDVKFLWKEGD